MNTEDYRERIEEILEWFIGYPRQDDVAGNYDEAVPKLLSLIQEAERNARIAELERTEQAIHDKVIESDGENIEWAFDVITDRIANLRKEK